MSSLIAALLLSCAGGHARLHPADADVYVEVPDVAALARAYASAPIVRLYSDPALQKLRAAAGMDAFAPAQLVISMLTLREGVDVRASFAAWSELSRASLSVRGIEGEASGTNWGALFVLDFATTDAASRAASLFDGIEDLEPVAVQGEPHAHTIDLEGQVVSVVRRLWKSTLPRIDGWTALQNARLFVGCGRTAPENLVARAAKTAPALPAEAELFRWPSAMTASSGATVLRGRLEIDELPGISRLDDALAAFGEQASASFAPFLGSRGAWRIELRGDRFVTEGVTTRAHPVAGSELFVGDRPVPARAAQLVPAEAHGAWLVALNAEKLARLARQVVSARTTAAAADAAMEGDAPSAVSALASSLGTSAALYLLPITNIQSLRPPLVIALELTDRDAFEKNLAAWCEALTRGCSTWKVQTKPYHKIPLYLFSPKAGEGHADAGVEASFRPAVAVLPDRVLITVSPSLVRSEIARIEKGAVSVHPIAVENAFPKDAFAAGMIDWAGLLARPYDAARGFLPLMGEQIQLPFDPAALPPSSSWASHFRPSLAWTRCVDGQMIHYAESSFGPETPLAFLALAAVVSQSGMRLATELGAASAILPGVQAGNHEHDLSALVPVSDLERKRTEAALREVTTGLAVFKSMHGGLHPARLDELVVPTDSFPRGFLDSTSVPQDAWGRSFVYSRLEEGRAFTLWSCGPDGADEGGRGDDVRLP